MDKKPLIAMIAGIMLGTIVGLTAKLNYYSFRDSNIRCKAQKSYQMDQGGKIKYYIETRPKTIWYQGVKTDAGSKND